MEKPQEYCWCDAKCEGWTGVVKLHGRWRGYRRQQDEEEERLFTPHSADHRALRWNVISLVLTSITLGNNFWSNLSATYLFSFISASNIRLIIEISRTWNISLTFPKCPPLSMLYSLPLQPVNFHSFFKIQFKGWLWRVL